MEKNILSFQDKHPTVADNVAIFPGARVIGSVSLAPGANIWYNAVLRADEDEINIGEYTNIQDGCVIHCDLGLPCNIGKYVTVGHKAVVHGCSVGDYALIGMNSCVLDGAEIGEGAVVGAGALVTAGTKIPPYAVAVGNPAKVIKTLDPSNKEESKRVALVYFHLAQEQIKEI